MTDKVIELLAQSGPLALVLALAAWGLWRAQQRKDEAHAAALEAQREAFAAELGATRAACADELNRTRERYEARIDRLMADQRGIFADLNDTLKGLIEPPRS